MVEAAVVGVVEKVPKNLPDGGDTNGGAWGICGRCENDGGGWGGGHGGEERLLLLLLLLLLLILLSSSIGSALFFNLFNLFLIVKSIPSGLGAFFLQVRLLHPFFQHLVLVAKNQQLDFQHQMLEYLQKQVQVDSAFSYYFH